MTRTSNLGLFVVSFGMLALLGIAILVMFGQVQDVEWPRTVPTIAPGLKPGHHGELNRSNVPSIRYDELRKEYEDNSVAQQEIDIYDPTTEYHNQMRKLIEATELNDMGEIAELEDWFKKHYPDIY